MRKTSAGRSEKLCGLGKIIPTGTHDHLGADSIRVTRPGVFSVHGELGQKFQFWVTLRASHM